MKPINVIIVDDDKRAIDYLQSLFDWSRYGFNIVATALNGNQGYQQYIKYSPQLVITDMRMPHGNGIDLVKKIRKHSAETKILLLTAYCDFDVAKEAIALGITEYIIKDEINEISIKDKLCRIKEIINKDRNIAAILNTKILSDIFNAKNDDFGGNVPNVDSLLRKTQYSVIVERDNPFLPAAGPYGKAEGKIQNHFSKTLLRNLDSGLELNPVTVDKDRTVLLVEAGEGMTTGKIIPLLTKVSQDIQQAVKCSSGDSCTFFIVPRLKTVPEIKELYRNKKDLMTVKHLFGCGKIYNICDIKAGRPGEGVLFDKPFVEDALRNGYSDELADYLCTSFQAIAGNRDYKNLVNYAEAYMERLSAFVRALPEITKQNYFTGLIEKGRLCLDIDEIRDWCLKTVPVFCGATGKYQNANYSRVVKKSIDYINRNYHIKTLSIIKIGHNVGMSASRLSVLFKEETNQTINKYLTYIRVEEAKRLLMEGELRINEISEKVGYGSSQYFSQVFHELTGMSPREYRKKE